MNEEDKLDVALEMLGSRLVGDFVRLVWDKAPEAQKKELAEAVMGKALAVIRDDSFVMRDAVEHAIRNVANEFVAGIIGERKGQIRDAIEKIWPTMVDTAAKSALKSALGEVGDKLNRALKGW